MRTTAQRTKIVVARIHRHRLQQLRRRVHVLGGSCCMLFALLVACLGRLSARTTADIPGLYGAVLLHQNAGGYVLVGVVCFVLAVLLTLVCTRCWANRANQEEDEK